MIIYEVIDKDCVLVKYLASVLTCVMYQQREIYIGTKKMKHLLVKLFRNVALNHPYRTVPVR